MKLNWRQEGSLSVRYQVDPPSPGNWHTQKEQQGNYETSSTYTGRESALFEQYDPNYDSASVLGRRYQLIQAICSWRIYWIK